MSKLSKRVISVLILFILVLAYGLLQKFVLNTKLAGTDVLSSNSVLKKLPQVEIPIYKSKDSLNLETLFETSSLVVHFWASWCGPCENEFPEIIQLAKSFEMKKDLTFLFVVVDDEEKKIDKFLRKFDSLPSNVRLLLDNDKVSQNYFGTFKLPETFVFGRKNNLIRRFSGAQKWENPFYSNYLDLL